MSKYRGPRLRVVRRLGEMSAFTRKIPKNYNRPGQHGENRGKPTQFSFRLTEKQKLRFYYGILEKQINRYVIDARKAKGSTGKLLLQLLEIRLDNIIYRIGWAPTLPAARQLVNHGHILVNQNQVTFPSFSCSPGQSILFKKNIYKLVEKTLQERDQNLPSHLTLSIEGKIAKVNQKTDRREVPLDLNELLVIEYYSNRL